MAANPKQLFERRARRTRAKLRSTRAKNVRLSVFRSNQHIYAQLIDDVKGVTLASASTMDKELKGAKGSTLEGAKKVGALIAERGKKAKVESVAFDRGGYIYHGRVKALAEAAREAGLKF